MFKVSYIDKKIIDKINFILENNNLIKDDKTCTVGGYQTNNIVDLFSEDLLKEMIPEEDFYKKIFHLHYINYNLNGYQRRHKHDLTEKYSFILYLNNANGDTIFEEPINKRISPEIGKLILFSSNIWHMSKISNNRKRVLVGAVDKIK